MILLKFKTYTYTSLESLVACLPSCLYPWKVFQKTNSLFANIDNDHCLHHKCYLELHPEQTT